VIERSRVRREHITLGRLQGTGRRAEPEIADYVLMHRNHQLAAIEAKARDKADTEGVGQAKRYAAKLGVRFAFSTGSLRSWERERYRVRTFMSMIDQRDD